MSPLSIWELQKHQMTSSKVKYPSELQCTIVIPTLSPPWQGTPNERSFDSSPHNLSLPPISPIINNWNKAWPQLLVSHSTVGLTSTKPLSFKDWFTHVPRGNHVLKETPLNWHCSHQSLRIRQRWSGHYLHQHPESPPKWVQKSCTTIILSQQNPNTMERISQGHNCPQKI